MCFLSCVFFFFCFLFQLIFCSYFCLKSLLDLKVPHFVQLFTDWIFVVWIVLCSFRKFFSLFCGALIFFFLLCVLLRFSQSGFGHLTRDVVKWKNRAIRMSQLNLLHSGIFFLKEYVLSFFAFILLEGILIFSVRVYVSSVVAFSCDNLLRRLALVVKLSPWPLYVPPVVRLGFVCWLLVRINWGA